MICVGFGEREGTCTEKAGTPWTRYWCTECDAARRAHITQQLEQLTKRLGGGAPK